MAETAAIQSPVATQDIWEKRYQATETPFGTEPCSLLPAEAHRIPIGASVISVGEGDGRHGLWLARERKIRLTAVDISQSALAALEARADLEGVDVKTIQSDLSRSSLDQKCFDVALWFFLHMPKESTALALTEVAEALKPGGLLIGRAWHSHDVSTSEGRVDGGITAGDLRTVFYESGFLLLDDTQVKEPPGTPNGKPMRFTDFIWSKPAQNPDWKD